MSNEDLTKLIVMLGTLGYRVVSISPEQVTRSSGEIDTTGRTALVISQQADQK